MVGKSSSQDRGRGTNTDAALPSYYFRSDPTSGAMKAVHSNSHLVNENLPPSSLSQRRSYGHFLKSEVCDGLAMSNELLESLLT